MYVLKKKYSIFDIIEIHRYEYKNIFYDKIICKETKNEIYRDDAIDLLMLHQINIFSMK